MKINQKLTKIIYKNIYIYYYICIINHSECFFFGTNNILKIVFALVDIDINKEFEQ